MFKRILFFLLCLMMAASAFAEEEPVIPELTSTQGCFPKNQRYDVYEGPRAEHRRAGNGKAVVSTNGEIMVYGTWMAGC